MDACPYVPVGRGFLGGREGYCALSAAPLCAPGDAAASEAYVAGDAVVWSVAGSVRQCYKLAGVGGHRAGEGSVAWCCLGGAWALCVLAGRGLHVLRQTSESSYVPLPHEFCRLHVTPFGLVLQRTEVQAAAPSLLDALGFGTRLAEAPSAAPSSGTAALSLLFSLRDPLAVVKPMAVACEGCSLADCRKSYLMDNSLELIWCCSELPIAVVFDHAHAQHLIVHVLLQPPQSVDLATPLVTDADTIAEIFIGPVTAPLFRDSNRSPRACRVLLATTYDNSPLVCWLRDSPGDLVGVKVDLAGNIAQQVFTIACCMSAVSLDMELLNFGQRKFILALTNSRKMQLFLENMPVSQYETPKDVTEVRDPVAGQFSLYASPSEHSLYRCTLRDMPQASLVKQCLSALAQCLTHNESITVLAAFCRTLRRGATGAGDPEWSTLQSLLCSACDSCGCGGGSESASGFGGSSAWEELLNSDYHLHMRRAPEMARLWQPSTRFAPLVSHWHEEECTAILKKHLPAIVEALHLLLQDLQLNTLCASSALLLARLLSCLGTPTCKSSYAPKHPLLHYFSQWLAALF
eukprot:TRINITY_DN2056_c0_g1_i4.p1 TRINITY_DN2056_c0_g1~~TRINITY_DN2056_c0_g1_i4.p1  ORF type:complete len:595 (+),score=100.62 TRINITY_DN2056_c0_g1_i4:59-1786(+)